MGQRVVLIHLVDADGVIAKTVADSTNAKARCFVAAYTGAHMPKPPFSPFPVKLTMN